MSKDDGESTTVQKSEPWIEAQRYLTGNGVPGLMPESALNYLSGGWSQQHQNLADAQSKAISGRTQGQVDQFSQLGNSMLSGGYDPSVQSVGPVGVNNMSAVQSGYQTIGQAAQVPSGQNYSVSSQNVNSQNVDPNDAFGSLGAANPTSALQQSLSGQVNNPYLAGMQQASTQTAMNQYNDAVQTGAQSLNYDVLPGIRSGAQSAGQYGGSRQGIAEGLAMGMQQQQLGRNARDLGIASINAGSNLYGNAYANAQNTMASTANNMAGLGVNNAQSNASRNLSGQTTNAGNSLAAQQYNGNLGYQSDQFNANAANNMSQFGATMGQNNNQFNAGAQNSANQYNANAANNMGQFNANLGFQNNRQDMAYRQQQLGARLQGLNTINAGNSLNDQAYQQQMGLLNDPSNSNWNNLNQYANIVGANRGSQNTTSTPNYSNPVGDALGLGIGALGLYNGISKAFA